MTQTNGHDASPPCSEAQTTTWLAWLARGMQQRSQTIFLIEQLQPSWLTTRSQHWVYILASRPTWGIVSGLVTGLILGLVFGLDDWWVGQPLSWLALGFKSGLIGGLIVGLLDVMRNRRKRVRPVQNTPASTLQIIWISLLLVVIVGPAIGLIIGLINGDGRLSRDIEHLLSGVIVGPVEGVRGGLTDWLSAGLITCAFLGPIWSVRSFGRSSRNETHTVETIRFSLAYAPRAALNGSLVGLMLALILGLSSVLAWLILAGPGVTHARTIPWTLFVTGAIKGELVVGLVVALIVGLVSCFRPGVRDLKTLPNQGIRLTLRSAWLMGGIGGLCVGLILTLQLIRGSAISGDNLLMTLKYGAPFPWLSVLVYVVLGGLCVGMWYGGLDVAQHYIVRTLLWWAGTMPRDYARFLDYASDELNFLQKVGGGYMFVHRYLLEYLAALALPARSTPQDGHDPSPSLDPGDI